MIFGGVSQIVSSLQYDECRPVGWLGIYRRIRLVTLPELKLDHTHMRKGKILINTWRPVEWVIWNNNQTWPSIHALWLIYL
jgi:hypothetical protein